MRQIEPRRCMMELLVAVGAFALGCGEYPTAETEVEVSTHALVEYRYDYSWIVFDESAAPLHVAVTQCSTAAAATEQNVDCPAHHGYALVGGGAQIGSDDGTALLTESRQIDPYYWRARSKTHVGQNGHYLHVSAVAIRLDGVNVQDLRDTLPTIFVRSSYQSYSISDVFPNSYVLSGGILPDSDVFVKSTKWITGNGWYVEGKDHLQDNNRAVLMAVTTLPKGIIEGFGALQLAQRKSARTYVASGSSRITSTPTAGYAVVGYGAEAETSSGRGRLLYGYGPDYLNTRQPIAASANDITSSAGYTTAYWVEARKFASSHGMCNVGAKLSASMDSCVATICANSPKCCNTRWDQSCVARVQTDCGKSCDRYTCSAPTFDPSFWTTPEHDVNCYSYAVNTVNYGAFPGWSFWYNPEHTVEDMTFALTGDGLISTTKTGICPESRTKIALLLQPNGGDYHFLRRDQGTNLWSHKLSFGATPTQKDSRGVDITDPSTAYIEASGGAYSVFGGYFCACQDSEQGQGHTRVGATGEYPW